MLILKNIGIPKFTFCNLKVAAIYPIVATFFK
jgi:hypothetical protein